MDLLEIGLTIAFSLLFCFNLAKLLTLSQTADDHVANHDRKCKPDRDLRTERKLGFLSEFVLVDKSANQSVHMKLAPQDFSNESCGSPKMIEDGAETYHEDDHQLTRDVECDQCQEENLLDEGCQSCTTADEIEVEVELIKDEECMSRNEEIEEILPQEDDHKHEDVEKEVLIDEEDDWEGVERSELERLFGAAVAFVGSKDSGDKISCLSSDLQLQLYGLHKVAIQGPCYAPQPMALKLSARAKWSAWQQLGNMSPEAAMEQYIKLLSTSIPEWTITDDSRMLKLQDEDHVDADWLDDKGGISGSQAIEASTFADSEELCLRC